MKVKIFCLVLMLVATILSFGNIVYADDPATGIFSNTIMEDDFSNATIDTTKWKGIDTSKMTVQDGRLQVSAAFTRAKVNRPLMTNFAIEFDFIRYNNNPNSNAKYFRLEFRDVTETNLWWGAVYFKENGITYSKGSTEGVISNQPFLVDTKYYGRVEMLNGTAKVFYKLNEADPYTMANIITGITPTPTYLWFCGGEAGFKLDNVKLYGYKEFTPECKTVTNVGARPNTKVKIGFSLPPAPDTINSADILLTKNGDSTPIPFTLGSIDSNGEYELELGEWLEYDTSYNIEFINNSATSIYGQKIPNINKIIGFKTRVNNTKIEISNLKYEKKGFDGIYTDITASGIQSGIIRISANLMSTTLDNVEATLLALSCAGENNFYLMNNFSKASSTIVGENKVTAITLEVNVPENENSPFIKLLFWDNILEAQRLIETEYFR